MFDVTHSDCYTKYGFARTGCCCCPYGWVGGDLWKELEAIKKYEPKMYKACCHTFKDSYEYTRMYMEFVAQKRAERKRLRAEERAKKKAEAEQLKLDGV